MRCSIILDFMDKCITEKIYKKAREQEKIYCLIISRHIICVVLLCIGSRFFAFL